jgi:hypothetical protein
VKGSSMATASEMIAQYKAWQREHSQPGKACAGCGRVLQETVTGNRPIGDRSYCSDCYYEQLGDLVESHPITSGRARRG